MSALPYSVYASHAGATPSRVSPRVPPCFPEEDAAPLHSRRAPMHPRRRTSRRPAPAAVRALATTLTLALAASALSACGDHPSLRTIASAGEVGRPEAASGGPPPGEHVTADSVGKRKPSTAAPIATPAAAHATPRAANKLGRIPVLEYHLLGGEELRWKVDTAHFRRTLQLLYDRGYRPINISDMLDRKIDIPAGTSPVVFVFDDASPSQFSYIERDGRLEVDPNSAVGMLLEFNKRHPDWKKKGVFCMLPAAQSGHAFFGEKGIAGQKSEWRFKKVQFLAEQGFELCNHTLYHANLGKQTDERAQEYIARGQMAIDSAVPGYKVRTFALPLGVWPKNRPLAWAGSWTDPRSRKPVRYQYDAVLEVAGGPTRSPFDPQFNPRGITRIEAFGNEVERMLDQLDRSGNRYVSDGGAGSVAKR